MRKGKQGFKVLAALVAATTICAASATAFADGTFTTTTEYELGTGLAKVTSTVSGIDSVDGEEVAFLVSEGDITKDGKIIYIDQQTAKGTATFTFKTDVENAKGNALVRFGSTKTASSGYTPVEAKKDDTVILPNGNVSFTYDENVGYVEASVSSEETAYGAVQFYIAPAVGYKYDSATVNGSPATIIPNDDGIATYVLTAVEDVNVEFSFVEDTSDVVIGTDKLNSIATVNATDASKNNLVAFATITGNASEYGVLVSKSETDIAAVEDVSGLTGKDGSVRKFAAWGANKNGQFAISLTDGGANYLDVAVDGKYYVRPYAIDKASGRVSFGAVETITVAAQ